MNVLPAISGSNNCIYFKIFNCCISFTVSPDMKILQVANQMSWILKSIMT